MGFDYSRLDGKITEITGTRKLFADKMNLSERSISLKMNNKIQWKQSEIEKACQVLRIPASDIPLYFFTPKVQYL